MPTLPTFRLSLLSLLSLSLLSGCQLIKLQENQLSTSLAQKNDSILTTHHLSEATRQLLSLEAIETSQCLAHINECAAQLHAENTLDKEQVYAAVSELYLSKALQMNNAKACTSNQSADSCTAEQLGYLDKSLRNSFVYLFYAPHSPSSRVFDLRQGQVRTFYNVALSQIILKTAKAKTAAKTPKNIQVGKSEYAIDISKYPSLLNAQISQLQSSYNLNFTCLDRINRQEGIGAEFVIQKAMPQQNSPFILDPESVYQDKSNPNIRDPRYLALSSIALPVQPEATAAQVLSGQAEFKIQLIDPNLYQSAHIQGQDYTLTVNYSVPFGLWLRK
ncbi:hypothetical protein [Acinetobacter tianfuensis]|nr:hypothetical protein [Acinetobacter tianfuensis]